MLVIISDCIDRIPSIFWTKMFAFLKNYTRHLLPQDRKVTLTMKEYLLASINPEAGQNPKNPSHIVIFCICFYRNVQVNQELLRIQPLGGLLLNLDKLDDPDYNLAMILGEYIKGYLYALSLVGLTILATVSSPSPLFKRALSYLTKCGDVDEFCGILKYHSPYYRTHEIVHIFDFKLLLLDIQNQMDVQNIQYRYKFKDYLVRWSSCKVHLGKNFSYRVALFEKKNLQDPFIFRDYVRHELDDLHTTGLDCEGEYIFITELTKFLKLFDNFNLCIDKRSPENWNFIIKLFKSVRFINKSSQTQLKEHKIDLGDNESKCNDPFKILKETVKNVDNSCEIGIIQKPGMCIDFENPDQENEEFSDSESFENSLNVESLIESLTIEEDDVERPPICNNFLTSVLGFQYVLTKTAVWDKRYIKQHVFLTESLDAFVSKLKFEKNNLEGHFTVENYMEFLDLSLAYESLEPQGGLREVIDK